MLVFAEMYGGGSGMGYFVKKNSELGVFANTWVGFIFMVIVLVVVMQKLHCNVRCPVDIIYQSHSLQLHRQRLLHHYVTEGWKQVLPE